MSINDNPDLDDEAFSRNLDHARTGYSTAQDTVRFIDAKTSIMTGALIVTTGLPFAFANFVLSDKGGGIKAFIDAHKRSGCFVGFVFLLGLFFGVLSLLSSTNGLMARTPVTGAHRERGILSELVAFLFCKLSIRKRNNPYFPITSLFPLYPPERILEAGSQFAVIGRGGYSKIDILREYEVQLGSIGNILNKKINRNRDAVRWFEMQILAYSMGLAATIALAFFGSDTHASSSALTLQKVQSGANATPLALKIQVGPPQVAPTKIPIMPTPFARLTRQDDSPSNQQKAIP